MINTRFSVAVHILSLLASEPERRLSSSYIAASVNTNPVVIRRISGMLKQAGLLQTKPGVSGSLITRAPEDITLLDIYRAVQQDDLLFSTHSSPNPDCPVGRNIQSALEDSFKRAQNAMEAELEKQSLADVTAHLFV
ncbi:Rrf2 family transcriptional regulator [Marinococcus sp. PL1-022]|jgi:DNA-binding IscR family transcriptional regulator|uniref:Rrf2 family transcriptional regulator n=1 Tax=Marinococcus sp. PL1-022 TaxID=3095363 RepID=UPI00261F9F07|nr:Rrf2 family transcriptional regulator [Marinococcus sp. PL1-022]MDX6151429.1 Rrf2 family transcriptional regulator [Marinococcus sp. PL1-022]